ncbi:HAD family hydrolase [Actinoplanes sp. NPDC051633]|uniref:HAD family hydrolase n=1 Tax=Actinoplanes sp. NPDC051633 TaxID=3155670 RepID=UPI00342CEF73
MIEHIVWDWNGTLFADGRALIDATVEAFRTCGLTPITGADYQRHHTQPIPAFYERLAGRALSDEEQLRLEECFRVAYTRHRATIALTSDAATALTEWAATGRTQSLLSMYPQDQLLPLVETAGIGHLLTRIDGTAGSDLARKAPHLVRHLERQRLDPGRVLLVGDSVDDVHAARSSGVTCVVYHSGPDALHARDHFAGLPAPVVTSLRAAVAHARALDAAAR